MLWLVDVARRVARGEVLYRDVLEINPPLIVWLLLPFARTSHPLEWFLAGTVGLAVASSVLAARALGRPGALVATLAVLLVVPIGWFGQREHLAIALILPWLLGTLRERDGRAVGVPVAVLAGIGFSLKPQLLVAFVLVTLFTRRLGRGGIVLLAVVALYALLVAVLTPDYAPLVRRLGADYLAYGRASPAGLLWANPCAWLAAVGPVAWLGVRRARRRAPRRRRSRGRDPRLPCGRGDPGQGLELPLRARRDHQRPAALPRGRGAAAAGGAARPVRRRGAAAGVRRPGPAAPLRPSRERGRAPRRGSRHLRPPGRLAGRGGASPLRARALPPFGPGLRAQRLRGRAVRVALPHGVGARAPRLAAPAPLVDRPDRPGRAARPARPGPHLARHHRRARLRRGAGRRPGDRVAARGLRAPARRRWIPGLGPSPRRRRRRGRERPRLAARGRARGARPGREPGPGAAGREPRLAHRGHDAAAPGAARDARRDGRAGGRAPPADGGLARAGAPGGGRRRRPAAGDLGGRGAGRRPSWRCGWRTTRSAAPGRRARRRWPGSTRSWGGPTCPAGR